jgi:hypothetical protein
MILRLSCALALMAVCVTVHAGGVSGAIRRLRGRQDVRGFWPDTRLFIALAGWMVLLHLLEISVWAVFYLWKGGMNDLQSSLYFSAITYTTTGYGDLVLKEDWKIISGVEALTGILMCGWSTGFFMAIVSRLHQGDISRSA